MTTDGAMLDRFHIGRATDPTTANILGISLDAGYVQWSPAGLRATLAAFDPRQQKIVGGVVAVMIENPERVRDREWMVEFAKKSGRPLIFALAQSDRDPQGYKAVLDDYFARR